ncbi:MAG TPA: cytochrome d ubiquinol oxidase subunit II [Bacteroidales bacterium]|nr:cytochrome d ubiquinol oxidase subunit II [Bacteroidales bacterium]
MHTFLGIDYPTMWFLIVGALFSGYAILDGFDLGAGAWHLFFKEDRSRRIALNAVGPVWDGNEVWLVIGGGALFAGFPEAYATLFSAMYIPFILFLGFLIFRAVSIEFRGEEPMKWWRNTWDIAYSISSAMMALLLGVVLGNVLMGIGMDNNFVFTGSWLEFLNPYSLVVGLTTLALFMVHGAIYLSMKTEGQLFDKIARLLRRSIRVFVILFVIITVISVFYFSHLTDRFMDKPILFIVPALAFLSIANVPRLASKGKYVRSFIFSALSISFLLILVAIELYPVIILNSADMESSMTIYNAASSDKALGVMLTITAIGFPLVIAYTVFVYRTFWGKVKLDETSY